LVDAFEAERRRIERDLHDGAQQRLVALSMTLGMFKKGSTGVWSEGAGSARGLRRSGNGPG
ncbi:histidine kinase dimerization/phosphoacceptor domain-containing protein, partial [Streptomyces griseus]|uniref:histidine kinase dimerization/phosphoacceptor domain-containing protein n=1 Tax=Streptomyces griseus TaxID=1911 RepID=UPI0033EF26D3